MRGFLCAALGAAALVSAPGAHAAIVPADDPFAGTAVLDEAELGDLRGGFELPNGQQINFGVVVSTYAGGALALQTELIVDATGASVQQTIGALGRSLDALTPAERQALGLDGVDGHGVVIADASGVTALVQNIANGGLQSIILNSASGRDLSQQVDVTITLPGFEAMQRLIGDELVGLHLHDDIARVLTGLGG
ncbi:MAG: hypothetical protein AB7M12_07950 [Hyphomonadaceae bacterium]